MIDRETGKYTATVTDDGVIPLWNDLHKGRHTGDGWSLVIDISAVLMTITSLTGLGLLFFLKRHRGAGLLCAAVGTVLLVVLYVWLVP